jgi:hypothetical protein
MSAPRHRLTKIADGHEGEAQAILDRLAAEGGP